MFSLQLVTIDWLKECFLQEKHLNEEFYRPELVRDNSGLDSSEIQKKRKDNYKPKKDLFRKATFAIQTQSFNEVDEDYIEGMRRMIMEHGGIVVDENIKSNYIIQEDGYSVDGWNKHGQGDSMSRKIIHFRFVEECIRLNCLLDEVNNIHLCPLPQRVPIEEFTNVTISLTTFTPVEKHVYGNMA